MFDLFGADTLLTVRFLLAFIIVLAVIGIAAWAVRRLGSTRASHAVRGRLPRLGVSDYASVDSRRRLVLVRRDNVEHLVMIGGPTDVVVEANIAKEGPLSRGTAIVGDPEPAATLARTLPLPGDGAEESWPLQPEDSPSRAPRKVADENIPLMHDEFQARPARGLARPQESAPLPLAPEPPVDPLSQRKGQEPGVRHQQPSERAVSWPPQPVQPASQPRARRNAPAPEEHENNPLMREEPKARSWRGAARLPEPPPLPWGPEPPVDPLPQRRSPLAPLRSPLAEPHAEVGGDYRQERKVADQQPAERSVSWPSQSEQPASRPRAPRNEPAPEEHENNSLMREEPQARPWRGAAPLPEAPLLPLAPEPPVDPLPQRRSPSAPRRPPLAEPRAHLAGDYRQEDIAPRHTPERSLVDESLAEMAQRLEATLRKPKSNAATAPAHPQANQSKAAAPANPAPHDDLEGEMAGLLGRSFKKPDDPT
jgi:flagellar protein FliO/FliZ